MSKTAKAEAPEAAVLFPEEEVGGYRFRPWSLEQFAALANDLSMMMANMASQAASEAEFEARFLELSAPVLVPYLPKLLGVTLGLLPSEVDKIPGGTRLALGLRIIINRENAGLIKNFVTGFMGTRPNPAPPTP